MKSQSSLLSIQGLAVSAGGRQLLTGVDLEIARKERVALFGPSGCGKTTLLRAVAGLVDADAGTVAFGGQSPEALGWPAFRRRVTYVEQRAMMLDATVEENLRRPFGYRGREKTYPADEALNLFKALLLNGGTPRKQARNLSEGEAQRLSLIRALLTEPCVLLLDEPTAALDEKSAGAVGELLVRWTDEHGAAALVVSHDRERARLWSTREFDLTPHLAQGAGNAEASHG